MQAAASRVADFKKTAFAVGVLLAALIPIFSIGTTAQAATSDTLNFQGRLLTDAGSLVPDGSYNIEFKIYDSEAAGGSAEGVCSLDSSTDDCWWLEDQTVTVQNGYFSVQLGDVTPFGANVPWDQELWLTMNVDSDGEMSPRFKLTAVPYAFRAGAILDGAGNALTGDDLVQASPSAIQALNTAQAAIRISQSGAGGLLQLQDGSGDVFTVANNGDTAITGGLTLGSATQAASLELLDGSGNSLTFQNGSQTGDLTFTLPGNYGVADQCLKSDGTGGLSFQDCPGGSVTVVKTADESVSNSNSLQNDDELTFNVEANEVWTVEFEVQATSNTTADYRYAIAAPSGSTCYVAVENIENAQSGAQSACGVNPGNTSAQNATDSFRVKGTINVGGTGGAVTLQWAQNTPNAGATTVHAGSYLTAREEGTGGGGGGGGGGSSFVQNGNAFGTTAVLGTTDTNGLDIITDGNVVLELESGGDATFNNALTVDSGLTITTGNIDLTGGGNIDLNGGDIIDVGDISATAGLTISSGGAGGLSLDSANNILDIQDATIQRSATGTTTIDLLDAGGGTTLSLLNSDGTQVAGLTVEGAVTAASFSGGGSGLTALDGSNIASGTLADARLSSNVALLDINQTFTGRPTFSGGLVLGNTATTTAGSIRWTGTDFEGYDGTEWVTLTGGGASLLEGVLAFGKYNGTTGTALDIDGASIAKNGTGDYTVTFDTAASTANYTIQLTVDEPAASLDDVNITADNVSTTSFDVDVHEGDNGTTADVRVDRTWNFIVFDSDAAAGGGGGGGGTSFDQGGNSFGATGILGTTDSNGLNIVTNGSNALTFTSGGVADFTQAVSIDGNLTLNARLLLGTLPTPDSAAQAAFYSGSTTGKGLVIQGAVSQTANLFEVQDSSGNVLAGFDASGDLVLGDSTVSSLAAAARTVDLPDASGTICLNDSTDCGFLPFASGSFAVDATTNNTIAINKTGAGGSLIALQDAGVPVFTVADTGSLEISSTDSAALDIQNVGGSSYFSVDTSSGTVRVGPTSADANGILFVLDTKNTAGDPTGVDGAQYYNSNLGKFRCFEDGAWVDCINGVQLIQVYDNAGGTNLNTAGLTAVPFGAETRKMTGFTHDNVTNNSRITMDEAGWYKLDYSVNTVNGGSGRITLRCTARLNGTTSISQSASYSYLRNGTDNNATNTGSLLFETTSANEYVEILCQQGGSGGTSNSIINESWALVERK